MVCVKWFCARLSTHSRVSRLVDKTRHSPSSLSEDDLLVDGSVGTLLSNALAELIQALGDGLDVGSVELVTVPLFEVAVDTLVVSEQLGQVLGAAVGNGPLVVRRLESRNLLLLIVFSRRLLLLLIFISLSLGLGLFDDGLGELFPLVLEELSGLKVELQADDTTDLTDVLLNHEELVHKTELKLVLEVIELVRVADTLKKDVVLVGALLSDGLTDQVHHEVKVEVHSGVQFLLKVVLDLAATEGNLVEGLGLAGSQESLALRSLVLDVLSDQLVHGQVEHVVSDGKAAARSVDAESLLVVHDDYFSSEDVSEPLTGSLKGTVSFFIVIA